MIFLLLLTGASGQSPDAMARYAAFMTGAKTLSVHVKATLAPVGTTGEGTLTFSRPASTRFEMTVDGKRYQYMANGEEGVEIDHSVGMYDEFPSTRSLATAPSSLSSTLDIGLPQVLLVKSLKDVMVPSAAFTSKGKANVRGVDTDVVNGHFADAFSMMDTTAYLDDMGRLLRYRLIREGNGRRFDVTYELTDYKVNQSLPASLFVTTVPIGYVPFAVPTAAQPVEAGKPLTMGEWQYADGRGSVQLDTLAKGKVALVVLADPEGNPSADLLRAIDPAVRGFLRKGGLYIVASTSPSGALSKRLPVNGVVYDPTGKVSKNVVGPGAPLVYLLDKTGKVVQAWLGFDAASPKPFLDELSEAIGKAGMG